MIKKYLVLVFGLLSLILDAKINFVHRTNHHATHQPVLYTIAAITTGPIIECGSGDSSTDLLHELCKINKRLLITIDDDFEWLNKFAEKYKDDSDWHLFFFVPGKTDNIDASHWVKFLDEFELLRTVNFDLCFVDQAPWMARYETIKRLKDSSKYIILHDCDYFPGSGIFGKQMTATICKPQIPGVFDYSDTFKYFKVYFPMAPWPGHSGPPTLLGSNFESQLPDINFADY